MISDLPYGGVEKFLLDLLPRFKNTLDVRICCIRERGKLAPEFQKRGIPVDLCYFKGRLHPQSIYEMVRYLKEKEADIVHTHMYRANTSGAVSAKIAGTPVIISHLHSFPEWDDWRQKKMDSLLAGWKDQIIAVSNKVKEDFIKATGTREDKVMTIYNGVDMSRFSVRIDEVRKKRELGIPEDSKVVGIFARLIEDKRHEVFLKAAKRIVQETGRKIHFLVVGKGKLEKHLKRLASELEIAENVVFTGLRDDVPELLKITDVSVLSSRREGFPMIILESMASGVPFISTNVGGVGEIIRDGESGFIVEQESPEDLAKAMITVLTNEDLHRRLAERSRKIVESFSIESNVMKLGELYDILYRRKAGKLCQT